MRQLEFGWFLPTAGDTTAYADRDADVPPSLEMFDRIVAAAEAAIGLAIVVVYFRNRGSIAVEDINMMKG